MTVRVRASECNRGFLLRPAGEYAGRGAVERRQRQRLRRISACTTYGHDVAVDHAYHGVVVARQDRAVVAEQRVGDAGGNEMLPCKGVVGLDGLFAQVSAGHDQRMHVMRRGSCKQQMLKRRIGEHDAELGQVVRDRWREGEDVGGTAVALANSAPAQQHNGADTAGEKLALSVVDMAQAPGIGKTAHHDGKRLIAATLATAQLGHRLLVGSVTG